LGVPCSTESVHSQSFSLRPVPVFQAGSCCSRRKRPLHSAVLYIISYDWFTSKQTRDAYSYSCSSWQSTYKDRIVLVDIINIVLDLGYLMI